MTLSKLVYADLKKVAGRPGGRFSETSKKATFWGFSKLDSREKKVPIVTSTPPRGSIIH